MRALDFVLAIAFSLVSFSIIQTMNPGTFLVSSSQQHSTLRAQAVLLSVVSNIGFEQLERLNPTKLCSSLARFSNQSIVIDALVDGKHCAETSRQINNEVSFTQTFRFKERTVELTVWAQNQGQ
jgi:hypothetical protein